MAVRTVVGGVGCRCIALLFAWSVPGGAQPPTVAKSPPNWTIGAGVFGAGDSVLSTLANPTFGGALERRVGPRTWVALDATGSYESREMGVTSTDDPPVRASIPLHTLAGAMLVGLRHEIVHGLVDVSVFSAGFIAAQRIRHEPLHSGETLYGYQYPTSNLRSFGLVGGFTLERQLMEALAVRLSLDLAKFSFSRSQTETVDSKGVATPQNLSARSFGVSVRPGLLLHFYF